MNEPFKNIRKEQIFAVILWAIALAATIIVVYMYYENKIEQLEQSIDEQSESVSHRMSEQAGNQTSKQVDSSDDSQPT